MAEGGTYIKQEGGKMVQIKDFAPLFLHERFDGWKLNKKTYMIPPIFQAKESRHEIGITGAVIYSDPGESGEKIIYDRLKELGDVGMFVVNGFKLYHVVNWNVTLSKARHVIQHKYSLPELPLRRQGQLDFIIFHHKLGVISLEVKNCSSTSKNSLGQVVEKAVEQLKTSHALIKTSAKKIPMGDEAIQNNDVSSKLSESEVTDDFSIPYKKVIALPSTKRTDFNRDEHPSLTGDILLLYEDDSKDISSFRKWWHEKIESPDAVQMSEEAQKDYERALSFILMIRHMGPVTELEIIKETHTSLLDYTYNRKKTFYPNVTEKKFPKFLEWCANVLKEKNKKKKTDKKPGNKEEKKQRKKRSAFLKELKVKEEDIGKEEGMEALDKHLTNSKYINGDEYSRTDEAIFAVFEDSYCLFFKNILEYFNRMRTLCRGDEGDAKKGKKEEKQEEVKQVNDEKEENKEDKEKEEEHEGKEKEDQQEDDVCTKLAFLKLESPKHFNELELHLSNFKFIKGEKAHEADKQLFKLLTSRLKLERLVFREGPVPSRIVMSSEQLAVFEGPKKQLIIGSPGSGKTELMRYKALELESIMKSYNEEEKKKKIMYIVANGSPKYPGQNSLFFHRMKEFFQRSSLVEVITIVMKNESAESTEKTTSELRKKIESGEYEHAFIDECWIGSKPEENKILSELVLRIPGYVWISSVFNYRRDKIEYARKVKSNTQPLLTALEERDGVVSYINQVMRGTNNIIELERAYSKLYSERSHPYGTKQILGHSYEGPPVTWAVEETIEKMYDKCVDIVRRATTPAIDPEIIKRDVVILDPADVLIVNFATRMEASRHLSLLNRLTNLSIPVWTFHESSLGQNEEFVKHEMRKVALLQAHTRNVSAFIDGVEWPMVVVILPSEMVQRKAKLVDKAHTLRNYDPYISFFRSMVKLFVISDKWTNAEEFLNDVKKHA